MFSLEYVQTNPLVLCKKKKRGERQYSPGDFYDVFKALNNKEGSSIGRKYSSELLGLQVNYKGYEAAMGKGW